MACPTGWRMMIRLAGVGCTMIAMVGCSSGVAEQSAVAPRVVRIVAANFAFDPAHLEVHTGELVRLVLENPSDLPHELFIGSEAAQAARRAALARDGGRAVGTATADPAAVYVPAGGVAQLEYRFEDPTETIIGCHLAGHWESGMRGEVTYTDP